jgi:thiol reductant ABC exporter CydC subunit
VTAAASATGPATARPLRRLWRLADPSRARLALAALLAFLSLASAVGLLVVSAWLISRASQQPPILFLQVAIVGVRAFGISRGVFRYAERLVAHDAAFRSLTNLRVGAYERLERLSPAGLGAYRRGDLLARLVGDVDSAADLIVRVALPAVSGVAAGALAVLIGWALLPAAGLALLSLLAVGGAVVPWLTRLLGARAQRERAAAEGELSAHLVASLSAAPDLLAFGAVDAAVARVAESDAALTRIDRRAATATGLGMGLGALWTGLSIAACVGLGVDAVRAGSLDGVWLATLVLLPLAMADVLSGMPAAALARARVEGAADRLFAVLDAPDPVPGGSSPEPGVPSPEPGVPSPEPELGAPAPTAPEPTGAPGAPAQQVPAAAGPAPLALAGVAARYPGAADDALTGLDLAPPVGRAVALVGPSGAGKSTAAAVLLRLLDHHAGTYTIGGTDVRRGGEPLVRSNVAAMGQQAHLFDTTIEENLRLANRGASDAELRAAIEAAALADWVDALPQGLATRVGAHGSAVSGGQAQRIALARVLLAERPIVVLDEPGEHLDAAMADQVTAAAIAATAGRSVVLITHRMAHTGACAEVIVLTGGRVADRGAPEALGGWYAEAVARERGEPIDAPLSDPLPFVSSASGRTEADDRMGSGIGPAGPGADRPGADGPGADRPGADGPGADGPGVLPGADPLAAPAPHQGGADG